MVTLFSGEESVLHGWTISRFRIEEEWLTNKEVLLRHHIMIRGFYGCQDSAATENTFQGILDSVCNKFREDFDMDSEGEWRNPLQFGTIDYRLFGSVLCHYAEGTTIVTERLAGGS
jgi:hypothetical protein